MFVCICQFDESVCKLEATVKQLKSIGHHGIIGANACERSLRGRVVKQGRQFVVCEFRDDKLTGMLLNEQNSLRR